MSDHAFSAPGSPLPPSAADAVLAGLTDNPLGETSPSIYDTGRVVTLTPWLPGLDGRLKFLLDSQRPDGVWGATGGYAVLPTLSATEALLTVLRRRDSSAVPPGRLAAAAGRGLSAIWGLTHRNDPARLPDVVAAELIAPALVAEVNAHLDRLSEEPITGLDAWGSGGRLPLPPGSDPSALARAREHLRVSGDVQAKLWYSLEVMGAAARGTRARPVDGALACSVSATAAWLGHPPIAEPASIAFLQATAAAYGGAVPGTFPLYGFERTWAIGALVRVGIDVRVPPSLIEDLEQSLAAGAVGGAPGLPPDADSTSAGFATLARLGRPRTPDCLWEFELDDHFCCWQGERTPSPTANAHVLEAFAEHIARNAGDSGRHRAAVRKIVRWLAGVQLENGSWADKWHASPYYATSHCSLALDLVADPGAERAVRRAVEWTLATQNADGSWGIWGGTSEETAYAIHVLLHTAPGRSDPRSGRAAARGREFLLSQDPERHPPLWHQKDLFAPAAVCRAVRLAALRLTDSHTAPTADAGKGPGHGSADHRRQMRAGR
ncbi:MULTISPECIES: prenyltransferase/squalene oxidase repeat-containing protein [Streptosporangium]|uniref:Squalene cyclase C-terminal domain-containing protein n=1 Tax=Streptosporangium brasiliense TaxID=47480 RepID=A0ABT9REZ3_9ACTN|nr:prenyltransferase/squalene oxidase repeat-containing protein [Streptosporangium brasiliense]MDP9867824.1 hypothetical protein [Streptosporangium brasiliense]